MNPGERGCWVVGRCCHMPPKLGPSILGPLLPGEKKSPGAETPNCLIPHLRLMVTHTAATFKNTFEDLGIFSLHIRLNSNLSDLSHRIFYSTYKCTHVWQRLLKNIPLPSIDSVGVFSKFCAFAPLHFGLLIFSKWQFCFKTWRYNFASQKNIGI